MRFFLLDKVRELHPGKDAIGVKCWSLDNEIFEDHFPGFPTTPGVLLTESMAQLAGLLIEKSYYKDYTDASKVYPVLSIIRKAKFRHFVSPGDQCIIKAKMISIDRGRGNVEVQTLVDDKIVCDASLSFIIAMQADMDPNPYLSKRQQYVDSIMPKDWKSE